MDVPGLYLLGVNFTTGKGCILIADFDSGLGSHQSASRFMPRMIAALTSGSGSDLMIFGENALPSLEKRERLLY